VFIRKYYFFDSIGQIAHRYSFTESKVKNMLFYTRKKLKEYLIRINDLEEKGDHLYIEGMRALHTGGEDALTVIAWRDIYSYLERCMDACEHAADIVEAVIMKNS